MFDKRSHDIMELTIYVQICLLTGIHYVFDNKKSNLEIGFRLKSI